MADMIQIAIQAILDSTSEGKILESIKSIQTKINDTPFNIKINADTTAFDSITTKFKNLGNSATEVQQRIEQAILGSNETIAQQQARMNSAQERGYTYEQSILRAYQQQEQQELRNAEIEERNVETERLRTTELERQITLYREQKEIQLQNMQSSYGSAYNAPAIQSQVSGVRESLADLNPASFSRESAQINTDLAGIRANLNEARASADNFATDLAHNAVKMLEWTVVGGAIFGALKQIKDGFTFVNNLNTNMTNIAMITGKSHDYIVQMTQDYSNLASQLHETTSEIMTASEEFLRAGNTAEQTGELLKASTVMSKIAGQSQADSAQSLISVMNSYKLQASDMMGVVDKMVAVDNTSATSTAELSAAIQKTAFSAQAANVSLPELISYIGTISSVTRQSADKIGTSMNSIFSRYENVKAGVMNDLNGEPLNNVEKVLNDVGVTIRSSSGSFKSFDDVLKTLSTHWNEYNQVQQAGIATAIAGRVA